MINVNKLHCFLKEIENMFFVFLSSYKHTRESLGELEKLWKPGSISRSPKLPLVFLKLDRNTIHVFYF